MAGTILSGQFLVAFVLGALLIVFYAKDKFNAPNEHREILGSFAQILQYVPAIESHYRRGLILYVLLLLCFYTILSFAGPTTFFQNASNALGASPLQMGLSYTRSDVWPIVVATVLIAISAASDNSAIGRIEYFIRGLGYKRAYIPDAVERLAQRLWDLDPGEWAGYLERVPSKRSVEETQRLQRSVEDRKKLWANSRLLDGRGFKEFSPENFKQWESSWNADTDKLRSAQAIIVFLTLKRILTGDRVLSNPGEHRLAKQQENQTILAHLEKEFSSLQTLTEFAIFQSPQQQQPASQISTGQGGPSQQSSGDPAAAEQSKPTVRQFLWEASLFLAVLLTKAARQPDDLAKDLKNLGLPSVDLRHKPGRYVFHLLVATWTAIGAIAGIGLIQLMPLINPQWRPKPDDTVMSQFEVAAVPALCGALSCYIAFRAVDYLRHRSLMDMEWREGAEGYMRVGVAAAAVASVISLLTVNAFLSIVSNGLWQDPVGFVTQWSLQFLTAAMTVAFTLHYYRAAAEWQVEGPTAAKSPGKTTLGLRVRLASENLAIWSHVATAIVITAATTWIMHVHLVTSAPAARYDAAWTQFGQVRHSILESMDRRRSGGAKQTDPAISSTSNNGNNDNGVVSKLSGMLGNIGNQVKSLTVIVGCEKSDCRKDIIKQRVRQARKDIGEFCKVASALFDPGEGSPAAFCNLPSGLQQRDEWAASLIQRMASLDESLYHFARFYRADVRDIYIWDSWPSQVASSSSNVASSTRKEGNANQFPHNNDPWWQMLHAALIVIPITLAFGIGTQVSRRWWLEEGDADVVRLLEDAQNWTDPPENRQQDFRGLTRIEALHYPQQFESARHPLLKSIPADGGQSSAPNPGGEGPAAAGA